RLSTIVIACTTYRTLYRTSSSYCTHRSRKAYSTPQNSPEAKARQQPFSDWLKLSEGRFGAVDQLLFFGKQMRCFSDLHVFACLAFLTRNSQHEAIIGGQWRLLKLILPKCAHDA